MIVTDLLLAGTTKYGDLQSKFSPLIVGWVLTPEGLQALKKLHDDQQTEEKKEPRDNTEPTNSPRVENCPKVSEF